MKLRAFMLSLAFAGFVDAGGLAQAADGFSTPRFQPGLQFVANHFKGENNTVARLIPQPAEGTELYKVVNGLFRTNTFSAGAWKNPDETLEPGEGAIVFNPSTKVFTGTFMGQILQGNLINRIPAGLSLKSSMLPQRGRLASDLGLRLSPFDNVYLWKTNGFEVYTLLRDGSWFPSEPEVAVGEAFFIRANRAIDWVRTFNINQ